MLYKDVSASTSPAVVGNRRLPRRGIVIHTSMGYNSLMWLQGGSAKDGNPASSDFLIDRRGNIYQLTRHTQYAFHTGEARYLHYQELDGTLNQTMIGIELEAAEHKGQRITDYQYIALAALIRRLYEYHALKTELLVTHKMVAIPPGRKTDPRYLDLGVLFREMAQPSENSPYAAIPRRLP